MVRGSRRGWRVWNICIKNGVGTGQREKKIVGNIEDLHTIGKF